MKPALLTEALKNIRLVISEKDNVDVYRDAATCALDFLNEYVSDEVENLNLVPEKISSETYDLIYDTINALENIWENEPIEYYLDELKKAISVLSNVDYER